MKLFLFSLLFAIISAEHMEETLCTKYTAAVFGNNTAENQLALITAVVNLAVLGDAEQGVPGMLAEEGGLAPFFTGAAGATSNRGGQMVKINFLDGAGDLPNPPATSNTFNLFIHLYQFFGGLLGCTAEGFPAYEGNPSMYEVHKFMFLDQNQLDFFNEQVELAASALGVANEDVMVIGEVLDGLFNMRCTPKLTADDGVPSFLVGTNPSVCTASSCLVSDPGACPEEQDMTNGESTNGSAAAAVINFVATGAAIVTAILM